MKDTYFIRNREPEMHVNKPPEKKLWQKRGPFSIWYFIIMFLFLYLFQSMAQVKKEQIPYSQFQKYLNENQVSECVIQGDKITGTLKLTDQKTGKPRYFITVRLRDDRLANALEKHGVKYHHAYMGKIAGVLYIDDKAARVRSDDEDGWNQVWEEIEDLEDRDRYGRKIVS